MLAIRERSLLPDSPEVAEARAMLAEVHALREDPARARPLIDQALAVFDRGAEQADKATAETLRIAADVRRLQGDHAEARAMYERALAVLAAQRGQDERASCDALVGLGRLELDLEGAAAAVVHFEQAVARCPEDPAARDGLERARRANGREP